MHKPLFVFLLTFFIFSLPVFLGADERVASFGGDLGWKNLSFSRSLEVSSGHRGLPALVLSSKLENAPESDDLYLDFDSFPFKEATGNYSVVSSTLLSTAATRARRGSGAALCNTDGTALVLRGSRGSLFSTPGSPGSFTIEFWMQPAVTENGSVLFQWRSSRTSVAGSLYQYIRSSLFRNHMEWTFSNIWITTVGVPLNITLVGKKNLIPGQWSHHRISWDEITGLLEYCLDGSTEDVRYITSTGTETGDVYPAIFGSPADIEIATRFSGLIDEFRVIRKAIAFESLEDRHRVLGRYRSEGGRFETNVVDTGRLHAELKSLTTVSHAPDQTGLAFFVRAGDNFYEWTATEPSWISVSPREPIAGVTGRYFQVACELYPDGKGLISPSVTSVSVYYDEDTPPWPPVKLYAVPENSSVTLRWPASIDSDTKGYLLYYGERPGEYLSKGSPFDVGNRTSFTVEGLVNGRAYYFAIASYDSSGISSPGPLSIEAFARPEFVREKKN